MTKSTKTLEELHDLLRPNLGDETEEAAEALVEYVGLVVEIYRAIESDPPPRALLDTLTNETRPSTMTEERSFTNQYEKP